VNFEVTIAQLLQKHDCVIVPQLGGFVTFYKSAVIHPINHSIHPPSKQLGFNRHLTTSDGLLLNGYMKNSGLDIGQAQTQLDQWTQQVLNQLANGQKAHITGIGTLWTDEHGQMQFVPSEKFITDFTSFGLGNIQLPIRNQLPTQVRASQTAWKKLAVAASVAVLLASGLFVFQHNAKNSDTAGWDPSLKVATEQKSQRPAIPSVSNSIDENNFQQEFLSLWNAEPLDLSTTKKQDQVDVNPTSNQSTKKEKTSSSSEVAHVAKNEWGKSWVVGGVFKSKENALEQVSIMKNQGFSQAQVIPFQDFFYAVYGTAKGAKEEAQLRAKVLTVDPRAWTKR